MDQPYPPGSESEWRYASSDGYDESESVHETDQIQDGRSINSNGPDKQERLCDFFRSQGRIQSRPCSSKYASPSRSSLAREVLHLCRDALRIKRRSTNVHNDNASSGSYIREVWNVKTEVYLDDIVLLHQDPDRLKQIGHEVSLFLQ
jgi:hypothetical protein